MGWTAKFITGWGNIFSSPPFLTASGAHLDSYPKGKNDSFHRGIAAEYQKVGPPPFAFMVQALAKGQLVVNKNSSPLINLQKLSKLIKKCVFKSVFN